MLRASMHRPVGGALYYHFMSTLNMQIHLLWASSRQHECGVKQNKLSESVLPSVMLGWVTTSVCTSVYLCRIYIYIKIKYTHLDTRVSLWIVFFQTHLDTCVCEFMNKKWFSGLTISSRPQAGGMYRLGHLFSYKWGVHCWFCVCLFAVSSFIRKYFSQHISPKCTQTWYMYSWHKQAIVKRRIWLPSIAICIK